MQSIVDIINENAELYPDKTAFIYGDRRTNYEEFKERVNRLANGLSDLGVKAGDRIGILSKNRPEYFETYCTGKNGIIVVPLNFRFRGKELGFLIKNSGVETLIVEQDFVETIEQIRDDTTSVRNYVCIGDQSGYLNYEEIVEDASSEAKPSDIKGDDIWCIFYTSGTTGVPKGAMLTHAGLVKTGLMHIQAMKMSSEDIAIHVMPLFHVGGMWYYLFPCFMKGMTNIVFSQFRPRDFLSCVEKYRVTTSHVVPTMVVSLLEELRRDKWDVSSLRWLLYAASPMPISTLKEALRTFPNCGFFQAYGSTEVTSTFLSDEDHNYAIRENEALLSSCGRPLSDTQVRIIRDDGTEVAIGEIGEIAMRTERSMVGYWNDPEETAKTIKDGWVLTGDMGKLDRNGYLYISDRKKDMIVSGGENVYPAEVEEVLTKHPAVLEAAVIGVPDKKWIEAVKAVIIVRKGMRLTEREIIDFSKSNIAGFKCPKSVDFVDDLPKSPAGKILKRVLRKKYSAPKIGA